MSTVLTFGKYKNQTIQEVYDKDMQYARWLLNQDILIGSKPEIKSFLEEKFKDSDNSYLMTWGKYKSHTVKWIHTNDTKYFDWLRSIEYVSKNCPKLKAELDELQKQEN